MNNKRIVFITEGFLYSGESNIPNIRSNLEETYKTHGCDLIRNSLKKNNSYVFLSQVLVYNIKTGALEIRENSNLNPQDVLFAYGTDKSFKSDTQKKVLHGVGRGNVEKSLENDSELILDIGDFKLKGLIKLLNDVVIRTEMPRFVKLSDAMILHGSPMPYKPNKGFFKIGGSQFSVNNVLGGFFGDSPKDFSKMFNIGDDALFFNNSKIRSYQISPESK